MLQVMVVLFVRWLDKLLAYFIGSSLARSSAVSLLLSCASRKIVATKLVHAREERSVSQSARQLGVVIIVQ